MLQNWLCPLILDHFIEFKKLTENQFGKKIKIHKNKLPKLSQVKIVIIGINEKEANNVRKELYQMHFHFRSLKIADLGNIRKENISFLIPILKEFLDSGIVPILIGNNVEFTLAQYQAYKSQKQLTNIVLIDEKFRYENDEKSKKQFLNKILSEKRTHLAHLGLLGYQLQYTSQKQLLLLDNKSFDHLRLGTIHANIEEAEPVIRDADLLSFNLSAIRYSEAPAQLMPTPSGFFTEEACKLCRYAGMNDKLTSLGFYGYNADKENIQIQTAQVIAQMIWYFVDGFYHRKNDYPVSNEGLIEYIVHFKKYDYQITFWKSKKSSRWWMQIPIKNEKKLTRHKLVPCSYLDYQLACNDDLPDRLLNAYHRFE